MVEPEEVLDPHKHINRSKYFYKQPLPVIKIVVPFNS